MSSAIDELLLNLALPIIRDYGKVRYSEIASSSIIVFDHLLTIDDEVEYVWKKPMSLGKCLFILNRYYTLFVVVFNNYALFSGNVTDDVLVRIPFLFEQTPLRNEADPKWPSLGLNFYRWQGWTGLVVCMIAEIILQLRLYALYSRNKWILAILVVSFTLTVAASGTIMGTTLSGLQAYSNLIPGFPACLPLGVSTHFYAFWIPILCFETLLCSLALLRGYLSYKRKEIDHLSGRHILEILIRDSILYFIVMFATYFTTTMLWVFAPETYIEIPVGFSVAMSCVMGNRLLLNIRSGFKAALKRHTGAGILSRTGDEIGPFRSHAEHVSNPGQSGSFFSYEGGIEFYYEEDQQKDHPEVLKMNALRELRVERVAM